MKKRAAFLLMVGVLTVRGVAQVAALPGALTTEATPKASSAGVSAKSVRRVTMADLRAQFPQDASGAWLFELPQLLNTATDGEAQVLLAGQTVEVIGQLLSDGGRVRLFRAEALCCASHLRQCSVALIFAGKTPSLAEKTWVKLRGTLAYVGDDRAGVPVISVREVFETAKPTHEFLK